MRLKLWIGQGLHLKKQIKRILMAFSGVALCGFCVGIFNTVALGADPFTVFCAGIGKVFGLSYGTMFSIVTGTLLLIVLLVDRHFIHIATIFNLFGCGVVADLTMNLMKSYYVPQSMLERIICLIVSICILCFASSLYFVADLGVSGYDAMALILTKKTPLSFRVCRIGTDLICVLVGFLCGAVVGIGTLVTAFFMGPIIQWFNTHVAIPMLYGKNAVAEQGKEPAKEVVKV